MSKIGKILDKRLIDYNKGIKENLNKIFYKIFGMDGVVVVERYVKKKLQLYKYRHYYLNISYRHSNELIGEVIELPEHNMYFMNHLNRGFYEKRMEEYISGDIEKILVNDVSGILIKIGDCIDKTVKDENICLYL